MSTARQGVTRGVVAVLQLQAGAAISSSPAAGDGDAAHSAFAVDEYCDKPLALTYHDAEPLAVADMDSQAPALNQGGTEPLALTGCDGLEEGRVQSYRKQLFEPAL
jgi:hypothetical protein